MNQDKVNKSFSRLHHLGKFNYQNKIHIKISIKTIRNYKSFYKYYLKNTLNL